MRIKLLKAIPIHYPLEDVFRAGTYQVSNRDTIVTVVVFENGVTGETYGGDEDMEQDRVVGLINKEFQHFLVGRDIDSREDIAKVYDDLMNLPIDLGYRALIDLDMGRHGIQQQALSLVDLVLWDGLGKLKNKPVTELLGGAKRTRLPVISIGGYYHPNDPQGTADEAAKLREFGVGGLKMKVGRATFEEDLARINAAWMSAGKDFMLAVDVNQGWTVSQAKTFCGQVSDLGLAWLEEPVKWYDCLTGLAEVRKESKIPIVAGQGDISQYRSCDLVRYGAVDQLNTDMTLVGGITAWMRVAEFAEQHGVIMGHHEEPQVSLTTLSVVKLNAPVEIFANEKRDPLWRNIMKNPPRVADGFMDVPDGIGLGIPLNWDFINKFTRNIM
ncbi:MAG: mandelate racemase/muconate lactonizing enzyme family protein [Syntrophales bacterium]|jgi:D-arabinonate dehydratase|nr:mandelate racemase/muconate lactonizing enzyme family protein [Syntrophales bacterium]